MPAVHDALAGRPLPGPHRNLSIVGLPGQLPNVGLAASPCVLSGTPLARWPVERRPWLAGESEANMTRLWRVLEWGFTMTFLCWLFVRLWTDRPSSRRRRSGLLDRLSRRRTA